MKKTTIPVGEGLRAHFANPLAAIMVATGPVGAAFHHVMNEGGILRFDAIQGIKLKMLTGQATVGDDDEAILDDKWYGTLLGAKLVVGPFERKSQAMNGLALSLLGGVAGFEVEGVLKDEPDTAPASKLARHLADAGVPAEVVTDIVPIILENVPEGYDISRIQVVGDGSFGAVSVPTD